MKYIPGFEFVVGNIGRSGGSLLEQKNKKDSIARDQDFTMGKRYKLYNIKPVDAKVQYSFLTDGVKGSMNILVIDFNNIQEADNKIDKLIGG